MTDYTELRRLAQLAKDAPFDAPDTDAIPEAWEAVETFEVTFDPELVITLIDELEAAREASIDAAHLERQRRFSLQTFGPGARTKGVSDHIRKELKEIAREPLDLGEWADVIILGFDGAWRAGHEPQAIIDAIKAKQATNEARNWPDWRAASPDHAIEHIRDATLAAGKDNLVAVRNAQIPNESQIRCPACFSPNPCTSSVCEHPYWAAGK